MADTHSACSILLLSPPRDPGHAPAKHHGPETSLYFPFPSLQPHPEENSTVCRRASGMAKRSWEARGAGTLILLSWLAGASVIEPETCSSPGDFPPPVFFSNSSAAQEGDLIFARCLVFSHFPVARIFFCKNGVELANHPVRKEQFTSTLTFRLSPESSGTYSCGYLRLSSLGQVKLSRLSVPWLLSARGRKDAPRNDSIAPSPELAAEGKRVQLAKLKAFISC
ncbi:uncharacterized protein [Struthio camelus]|uniref:uncharacterized protein isoform X2 n=1 Tax=Struthio camelus TaxID=8801 RepID=UPI00051E5E06|nr:PREDICTED: uncharacterized protein LOC104139876 isoform X2 [Struthio camelus australis]